MRSPTHLVYAASYVRSLLEDGAGPVEVVAVGAVDYLGGVPFTGEELAAGLPTHPALTVRAASVDEFRRTSRAVELVCVGAPTVRGWASFVASHRGRRPRVVVVDEGLGSYGDRDSRRRAYRRQGGSRLRSATRAAVVASGNRLLCDRRWALYRQGAGGRWEVVDSVADEFRRRLHGHAPPAGRAVYLTQPWAPLGVLAPDAVRRHVEDVRAATAALGLELHVKRHPWDRGDVDDLPSLGPGPAELDRAVVGADLVLGTHSSALLNVAALHGTPTVRLDVPALGGLEDALTARQRDLLDAFLGPAVDPGALGADRVVPDPTSPTGRAR